MDRERQKYIDRHFYEENLQRERIAALENRAVVRCGDDDLESDEISTKEQMYLDIIKNCEATIEELRRKVDEAESKRQDPLQQQSLDKLIDLLAARDSAIESLTEELRLSQEKSAEQQEKLIKQQAKSTEQIRILQEKSAAEIKSLKS